MRLAFARHCDLSNGAALFIRTSKCRDNNNKPLLLGYQRTCLHHPRLCRYCSNRLAADIAVADSTWADPVEDTDPAGIAAAGDSLDYSPAAGYSLVQLDPIALAAEGCRNKPVELADLDPGHKNCWKSHGPAGAAEDILVADLTEVQISADPCWRFLEKP